jgi:hypothetical protein
MRKPFRVRITGMNFPLPSLVRAGLTGCLFALAACKTAPPPPPPPPVTATPAKPAPLYEWNGDGKAISGIVINVDEQKARLYHGKEEIGWTYVATGIPSFPTPTGEFKVLEKVADKVSNLYGKGYDANGKVINSDFKQGRDLLPPGGRFEPAKMTYFLRLTTDGIGMHIGPIPRPGKRASHGCIRLPSGVAGHIYRHIAIGTPVTIRGSGPDYATYMKQSAEKAKANAAKLAAAKQKAEEEAAKLAAETGLPAPGTAIVPGAPASTASSASSTAPATAPIPAFIEEPRSPAPLPGQ